MKKLYRLFRQDEIERIHGCELNTAHYSTAVQILGQGVLTRLFRRLLAQVASSLLNDSCLPIR